MDLVALFGQHHLLLAVAKAGKLVGGQLSIALRAVNPFLIKS